MTDDTRRAMVRGLQAAARELMAEIGPLTAQPRPAQPPSGPVARYPLEPGLWITLRPRSGGWEPVMEGTLSDSPPLSSQVSGAEAFAHLLRYRQVPPVEGFSLVRLCPAPEAAGGRPADDNGQVTIVGERVIVIRARIVRDAPSLVLSVLSQLHAVNFLGVPDTHGALAWTTPGGHQVPVMIAYRYFPRSANGRQALIALLAQDPDREPAETPSLTARMGRIAAALHVALTTRSSVLPEPVQAATAADLREWHARVHNTIDRVGYAAARQTPSTGQLGSRLAELRDAADGLAAAADAGADVPLQLVHGDLCVDRILRWAGGLMVTGLDHDPQDDAIARLQPASRDLARLVHSLVEVAEEVNAVRGDDRCTTEWLPGARARLIAAYRTELGVAGRPELFDQRLLTAFEAEHAALRSLSVRVV